MTHQKFDLGLLVKVPQNLPAVFKHFKIIFKTSHMFKYQKLAHFKH